VSFVDTLTARSARAQRIGPAIEQFVHRHFPGVVGSVIIGDGADLRSRGIEPLERGDIIQLGEWLRGSKSRRVPVKPGKKGQIRLKEFKKLG